MNFGGWLPILDANASALESPGVLQARSDDLVVYPRGKSAMLFYAASRADETLRGYLADRGGPGLARAKAAGARWIRFGAAVAPEDECQRLIAVFSGRFGAAPLANIEAPNA